MPVEQQGPLVKSSESSNMMHMKLPVNALDMG